MKTALLLFPIITTGCLAAMPTRSDGQAQPKLTLPAKNSVNFIQYEPKGCQQKKELVATESCTEMEKATCMKNINISLASQALDLKATHIRLLNETNSGGMIYQTAIAYDCTEAIKNQNKGAP